MSLDSAACEKSDKFSQRVSYCSHCKKYAHTVAAVAAAGGVLQVAGSTWQAAATTTAAVRAASGKSPERRRYINRLSPLLSDEAGKTIEQSIYGHR